MYTKEGAWRLLDEQNRGFEETVSNYGQCDKLSEQVFGTFSSSCFGVKSVYNYGPRGGCLAIVSR
jgi:hypothetical protein